MASETSGDSSDTSVAQGSSGRGGFQFRPSALSDVADKMWKNTSSSSDFFGHSTALPLPRLMNTNNIFHPTSASLASEFVFGKNIRNRVAHAADSKENSERPGTSTNGNGAGLFSNNGISLENVTAEGAVKDSSNGSDLSTVSKVPSEPSGSSPAATRTDTPTGDDSTAAAVASLESAAAAYEATKQTLKPPHLLAPDEVKTGEEDEVNVLQASVKLYIFDAAKKSWTDRGLAILRVNDKNSSSSWDEAMETRILVRLQGSLRVMVNTKLWPDMLLERVSAKRLRLSGTLEDTSLGGGDPKQSPSITVYLISGSQSDIDRIETALRDRLSRLKVPEESGAVSVSAIGKKRGIEQSEEQSSSSDTNSQEASPPKKRGFE